MLLQQTQNQEKDQSPLLDEITKVIVEVADPAKIILFGSQARGTAGPHSDYDFLILDSKPLEQGHSRRQTAGRIWRALRHFDVSIDLLLYKNSEVEYFSQSLNHVVSCALREGKVLHE